jgi:hypothetical protein
MAKWTLKSIPECGINVRFQDWKAEYDCGTCPPEIGLEDVIAWIISGGDAHAGDLLRMPDGKILGLLAQARA